MNKLVGFFFLFSPRIHNQHENYEKSFIIINIFCSTLYDSRTQSQFDYNVKYYN